MIRFVHPEMFYGLLGFPVFLVLHRAFKAWQIRHRDLYAEKPFQEAWQIGRHEHFWGRWRLGVWFVALGAVFFSLARPQWLGQAPAEAPLWTLYLVLDASMSMRVEDVAPSRLGAAKNVLRALVQGLPGIPTGLVVYEGEARFACPPTLDRWALLQALEQVSTRSLPKPGSALESGLLAVAHKVEARVPGLPPAAVVVVASDGEDNQGGSYEAAARAVARQGLPVFSLGLGTESGGAIPLGPDFWGNPRYRVFHGQRVRSFLNAGVLQRLAEIGGGKFWDARQASPEAVRQWAADLARHPWLKRPAGSGGTVRDTRPVRELFPWGILLAGLCLAAEGFILAASGGGRA